MGEDRKKEKGGGGAFIFYERKKNECGVGAFVFVSLSSSLSLSVDHWGKSSGAR